MRRYQLIIFTTLLALIVGTIACKKKTDQILSFDQLGRGSYIKVDSTISNEFNFSNIATSKVVWMISGIGEDIDKVVSYASPGNSSNKSLWKKIKETPMTNNKGTLSISGTELATALGLQPTDLKPGSQYTIFNEVVTKSGKIYNISNTSGDFEGAPDYNMALRLGATITCPFDPTGFAGNFIVISDNNWQDFSPGDIVQVTGATANSITLLEYPAPAYGSNRQPVKVDINPANGRASIASQYIGDYGSVKAKVSSSAGRASYVFSCTGDIILYQDVLYGSSTYANQLLKLKKQ